jgi:RNA polymerase sigma factor FliA
MAGREAEGMSMVRSEADVEQLVRDHQKLVSFMVQRYLQRYWVGHMEREDLVSWGMIGLLQAARAWDPKRARSFSSLACKAIERMIIRGVSREWKPKQAAVTLSLDEPVYREAGEPRSSRGGAPRTPTKWALGPGAGGGHEERFADRIADTVDLERQFLDGETRMAVRSAVQQLPAPERRLIERRFYEEIPVATLAQELGVTRQGMYQRQRKVLRRLRAALSVSLAGE